MYERITGENPYEVPMRIYPAPHYTMGGLWVDYNLMSNVEGLFVIGEANFSDHGGEPPRGERPDAGARRRLLRPAVHDRRLPRAFHMGEKPDRRPTTPASGTRVEDEEPTTGSVACSRPAGSGRSIRSTASWAGSAREKPAACPGATRKGCEQALGEIRQFCTSESYWREVSTCREAARRAEPVAGEGQPARVADYFELAELMCRDALQREESCGARTSARSTRREEGEALRNDEDYTHVRRGVGVHRRRRSEPAMHIGRTLDVRGCPAVAEELQVMKLTLHVWRQQDGTRLPGRFETLRGWTTISSRHASFLEMLDVLNEAAHRDRARIRSPSSTTAARAYAAAAGW